MVSKSSRHVSIRRSNVWKVTRTHSFYGNLHETSTRSKPGGNSRLHQIRRFRQNIEPAPLKYLYTDYLHIVVEVPPPREYPRHLSVLPVCYRTSHIIEWSIFVFSNPVAGVFLTLF